MRASCMWRNEGVIDYTIEFDNWPHGKGSSQHSILGGPHLLSFRKAGEEKGHVTVCWTILLRKGSVSPRNSMEYLCQHAM